MSKQAFLLSIFGLWLSSFVGLSQTNVTVGSNQETSGMVPIQHTSNYSYSQQIIYQSEINKEGSITKIRFNMAGSVALTNSNSWKIYMGYTTKTKFSGSTTSTDWVPIGNLTQVFSGLISTDTASGWKEIILTTPFNYNNSSNLIIAVQDIKNGTNSGAAFNVWTADTSSRVIKKFSSGTISTTAPGTGQLLNTVSYLQLDIDTAVTVPNYTVTFNTVGTPANGTLTATVNGSDIISPADVREGRNVIFTATPEAGFRIKEWKLNGNTIASYTSNTYTISNIAAAASVTVEFIAIPANEVNVTVGSSQATSSLLPIQHTTAYSYTQQIVYQPEINEEGSITKIRFNMAGGVDLSNSNMWNIYMGHTTKTKFSGTASSTDWVPVGNLTQVFAGTISTDQASGWKEIVLTTPFNYNNYDNLIIAVHETKVGSNTGAAFNVWTPDTTNRSIKKFSSSSISASTPGTGELLSIVNHLQLEVLTVVTYPVTFNTVGAPANGTLTATVDGNNIVSPREVREGKNVVFTATPNTGYRIKEWKLNGSTVVGNTSNTYTITNILAASDVTVEFELIPTYAVTYSTVNAYGTIAATANSIAFNSGDAIVETSNLVFTATPNNGYRVKEWKLNDVAVIGNITNVYNYDNLLAITDVKVEFEVIPTYVVTYSTVNAFGTIAATANGTAFNSGDAILEGANLVFTATPNTGYRVKEWKLNDVAVIGNTTNTYNYDNLLAITDVKVEFELIPIPTYTLTLSVNPVGAGSVTGAGSYTQGTSVAINTIPSNSNYVFINWTDGTNTVSTSPSFNYNMPNSNTTLTANYQNISSINGYSSTDISIYPNPANKSVTIILDGDYKVEFFDITGRRVLLQNISTGTSTIDIDNLPIGTYYVKMSNSKNTQTIKLIKS